MEMDDVTQQINVNKQIDDVNKQIDGVNKQLDDVNKQINEVNEEIHEVVKNINACEIEGKYPGNTTLLFRLLTRFFTIFIMIIFLIDRLKTKKDDLDRLCLKEDRLCAEKDRLCAEKDRLRTKEEQLRAEKQQLRNEKELLLKGIPYFN